MLSPKVGVGKRGGGGGGGEQAGKYLSVMGTFEPIGPTKAQSPPIPLSRLPLIGPLLMCTVSKV